MTSKTRKVSLIVTVLIYAGLFAICGGLFTAHPIGRQVSALFDSQYVPAHVEPMPFNRDLWQRGKARHRVGMVLHLIENKGLDGMSRAAVVQMLGEPDIDQPGGEGTRWLLGYHAAGLFDESVWLELTITPEGAVSDPGIRVDWFDPRKR